VQQNAIRASLVAAYVAALVDELIAAYEEAKRNYYLGGLRLSAIEGGRFAEAAFRMLHQEATSSSPRSARRSRRSPHRRPPSVAFGTILVATLHRALSARQRIDQRQPQRT
jgi:hypothetical protein